MTLDVEARELRCQVGEFARLQTLAHRCSRRSWFDEAQWFIGLAEMLDVTPSTLRGIWPQTGGIVNVAATVRIVIEIVPSMEWNR